MAETTCLRSVTFITWLILVRKTEADELDFISADNA